jgi:Acyl-CoA reductase (LuxC)
MTIQQISPIRQHLDINELGVFKYKGFELVAFDERVIEFSNSLSKRILADANFGRIPALTALAFWLRKANIKRIVVENQHLTHIPNVRLSPIGIVFHICPSNVDTMFVYSLIISLLMGNKNVLRISNRLDHEYINFLFAVLNSEMAHEESVLMGQYINIVTYNHDVDISTFFSQNANARLIWGGDNTAKTFKEIPANPRIKDIVFADRISLALFMTKAFLEEKEARQKEIVRKFYNDAYTFDQKGCSSPQSVFLLGSLEDNTKFEDIFYDLLKTVSVQMYSGDNASLASLKYNQLINDVIDDKVKHFRNDSATLYMVETPTQELMHTCGGGYFYIQSIAQLKEVLPSMHNKVQTISYYGLYSEDIDYLAQMTAGIGVDRIVPIGKALEFDYIWDGYNLCEELSSKKMVVKI